MVRVSLIKSDIILHKKDIFRKSSENATFAIELSIHQVLSNLKYVQWKEL